MTNSKIEKPIPIYRERHRLPHGTNYYADEEYILLTDNIMWIGNKKLQREGTERFIKMVKRERKLSDSDDAFFGESSLNKENRKIDFKPLCPKNLPSDTLIEYLKRAFYFSPRWYPAYCMSSIYYQGYYIGKIKDIVTVS